jgi:hypothetical protein
MFMVKFLFLNLFMFGELMNLRNFNIASNP